MVRIQAAIVPISRHFMRERPMIFGKIWKSIAAQFNKLANAIRGYDPIAEMQFEYDRSVEQIKEGREGLAQYRALVQRVTRQVDPSRKHVALLYPKLEQYLNY